MRRRFEAFRPLGVALGLLSLAAEANAQFSVFNRPVQVHGFFSQGFMLSDGNNYLGSQTSRGSFTPTDGGLNVTSQLTDKLRVGAQAYARKMGNIDQGHLILDWGFADYRVRDWFGVRAGKVKTVFGLYTDTQDMEFLHTWVLMPQSIYPADLRGLSVAHTGVDVYGSFRAGKAGTFAYTVFSGQTPRNLDGGRSYGIKSTGWTVTRARGSMAGVDLKWTTPLRGLHVGAARMYSPNHFRGVRNDPPQDLEIHADLVRQIVFSAQYLRGGLKLDWERNRNISRSGITIRGPFDPIYLDLPYDSRSWYGAGSYRFSKWLEVGAYHSHHAPNAGNSTYVADDPLQFHVRDRAATVRFDFRNHWDFKVEGHSIFGFGESGTSRGFYTQDNPGGLKPKTKLLVVRLGFYW